MEKITETKITKEDLKFLDKDFESLDNEFKAVLDDFSKKRKALIGKHKRLLVSYRSQFKQHLADLGLIDKDIEFKLKDNWIVGRITGIHRDFYSKRFFQVAVKHNGKSKRKMTITDYFNSESTNFETDFRIAEIKTKKIKTK